MEAKLSVIVPIYNVEKYLRQCVESILGQSMQEIELILVDDGSPDNCGKICDEYAQRDGRVKVIHQKNKGLIEARRSGVLASKCRYTTFVDGDDFIDRTSYELAAESMRNNIDIIIFGITACYSSGKQIQSVSDFHTGVYDREEIQQEILPKVVWNYHEERCGMVPSLCNKIMRRDLLLSCYEQLPNSAFFYGEDNAIFYPMLQKAQSVEIKEESYYYNRYRKSSETAWYLADDEYFEKLFLLYRYLKDLFKDSTEIIRQIEYYYMYSVSLRNQVYGLRKEKIRHLFPFDKVGKGERVVLYGAGIVGQVYMEQIEKLAYCEVVLWVDRNYTQYNFASVSPAEKIKSVPYDKVVIAIKDVEIQDAVERDLISLGVPKTNIVK